MNKFLTLCLAALCLAACSESDDTVEEFPDWQNANETYFAAKLAEARQKAAAGDASTKVLTCYYMDEAAATDADRIVVEVLREGTGSGPALYTDSVRVHYRGRLIPSTSWQAGVVFDQSFSGAVTDAQGRFVFADAQATPAKFAVSGVVDGFSTALQHMHIGDFWRVYIPYQLGYGTIAQNSIPACSTLIFDIGLDSYYHPGAPVPDYQ